MKAEYTIRDIRKPIPWMVVPPMMIFKAREGRNFALSIPACGPIISIG